MLSEGQFLHPFQDEQLNLRNLGEIDERFGDRTGLHETGTRFTMSSINMSTVTPWLAACGPSQMRCPSTYLARSWMSSGYTSSRLRRSRAQTLTRRPQQIGRASCRERV